MIYRGGTSRDNAAMDWVGTISTGVVGLAGIVASVWGSVSSQRNQSRRAEIDEKRRGSMPLCQSVAPGDQVITSIRRVRILRETKPDEATCPKFLRAAKTSVSFVCRWCLSISPSNLGSTRSDRRCQCRSVIGIHAYTW